jgi:WD40 repeat protein
VKFSPDGRYLLVAVGLMAAPRVLSAATGAAVPLPAGAVVRAFSPDGRSAFFVRADRTAGVADLTTGRPTAHWPLREPARPKAGSFELNIARSAAAFSPDGRRVAFGHDDGRISVWDAATGQEFVTLPSPIRPHALAFAPDGSQLAAAALDRSLKVWDLAVAAGSRLLAEAANDNAFAALAVSPDGRTLAVLRGSGPGRQPAAASVALWELSTGRERRRFPAPALGSGWVVAGGGGLQFSPDGRRLAAAGVVRDAGGMDRALAVWDVDSGQTVLTRRDETTAAAGYHLPETPPAVPVPGLDVFGAGFGPDGRIITHLVSSKPGLGQPAVRVWDAERNELRWSLAGDPAVRSAILSPDGRLCAVTRVTPAAGRPPAALQVWDVTANRVLWELPGVADWQGFAVAFSPDGHRLLTQPVHDSTDPAAAPWGQRAVVWNAAAGRAVCDFPPPVAAGPYGMPARSRFAFTADGRRLAALGGVPGATLWDADNGQELLTLGAADGIIAEAVFSSSGQLITRGQDGALRAWDGAPAAGPD